GDVAGAAHGGGAVVQRAIGIAMRRIFFLAQAEILHVVRDRATLAQALVVPIVQMLVLANAATFEIRNTPTWIVDLDRTSVSRGLGNRTAGSHDFDHVN